MMTPEKSEWIKNGEFWKLPWEDFLMFPLNFPYNEYELEVEAVARGNKPAHYGFYPVNENSQFRVLQKAVRGYKLSAIRGAGAKDYIITHRSRLGEKTTAKIKYLVMESNVDEDLLVNPGWHREFCSLLGYDKELIESTRGLRGPLVLEKKRHYKHYIQNAMSDLLPIPDAVLKEANTIFPDLYDFGKYLEM